MKQSSRECIYQKSFKSPFSCPDIHIFQLSFSTWYSKSCQGKCCSSWKDGLPSVETYLWIDWYCIPSLWKTCLVISKDKALVRVHYHGRHGLSCTMLSVFRQCVLYTFLSSPAYKCRFMCSAKWSDLEKARSHFWHWKGRCPVCFL